MSLSLTLFLLTSTHRLPFMFLLGYLLRRYIHIVDEVRHRNPFKFINYGLLKKLTYDSPFWREAAARMPPGPFADEVQRRIAPARPQTSTAALLSSSSSNHDSMSQLVRTEREAWGPSKDRAGSKSRDSKRASSASA